MHTGSSSVFRAGTGGGDGALSSSGVGDSGTSAKKKNTLMAHGSNATHCGSQRKKGGIGWENVLGICGRPKKSVPSREPLKPGKGTGRF